MFNRISVAKVPPGMTPEEARQARKMTKGPHRRDVIALVGLLMLATLVAVGAGWWFLGRGNARRDPPARTAQAASLGPAKRTATARAGLPPTATHTPTPTLTPTSTPTITPTPTLSPTFTPTLTPTRLVAMGGLFNSPPGAPVSPSPTPTPTIAGVGGYVVLGYKTQPETLYSYVSGWIVERDGKTGRPTAVRLMYPGGEMRYPRPHNTDIANGHYEFLVSPGVYFLQVDEPGAPVVRVEIGAEPQRHEISFKLVEKRPLDKPAISHPWSKYAPLPAAYAPTATPTSPPTATATAGPRHSLYLPLVLNLRARHRIYLPVVIQ